MYVETKNEKASIKLAAIIETKFKGHKRRVNGRDVNAVVIVAAMTAVEQSRDCYVVPTAYGYKIGFTPDLINSYNDFGYGFRVSPAGEIFHRPRS